MYRQLLFYTCANISFLTKSMLFSNFSIVRLVYHQSRMIYNSRIYGYRALQNTSFYSAFQFHYSYTSTFIGITITVLQLLESCCIYVVAFSRTLIMWNLIYIKNIINFDFSSPFLNQEMMFYEKLFPVFCKEK